MRRVEPMNTIMPNGKTATRHRARIAAVVVALLAVTIGLPATASATALVPFEATIAETFTAQPCPPVPSLCIATTSSGTARHLGHITEFSLVVSNLASDDGTGCFTETRATTLTAANGDQLTLEAIGVNCATGPTTVVAVDAYVVTGGTGRFGGATGSGTIVVTIDITSRTAVAVISGVVASPGSLS